MALMNAPEPADPTSRSPERESARQAADLAALRRMLEASRGCFSLSFAVCNDRVLRDRLIRELTEGDPGIVLVALPPATPDVLRTVKDRLAGTVPAALFVLDLEASIPFKADAYPTLRALNAARESWQRLACPVVFWLADYAVARVSTQAPDLWRYRSHHLNWLSELAYLYRHSSRFAQAEDLLRRALSIAERSYGPDRPMVAAALSGLAQLLKDTNRMDEAESLMCRTLAIEEENHGPNHPEVATALNKLAQLLQDTHRLTEAEPLIRRALTILLEFARRTGHPHPHPHLQTAIRNYKALLTAQGKSPSEIAAALESLGLGGE
jgi:tetratricopeptide (TPR) repeat protein